MVKAAEAWGYRGCSSFKVLKEGGLASGHYHLYMNVLYYYTLCCMKAFPHA